MRFSQSSIRNKFSDGRSVDELIQALREGRVKPDDLPPIRVFMNEGSVFTLDNTRLYAAQQAGVKIRTIGASTEEIARESWKFTTRNGGVSIRYKVGGG